MEKQAVIKIINKLKIKTGQEANIIPLLEKQLQFVSKNEPHILALEFGRLDENTFIIFQTVAGNAGMRMHFSTVSPDLAKEWATVTYSEEVIVLGQVDSDVLEVLKSFGKLVHYTLAMEL
ncbi:MULTISPECIES: hypothetical protein [Sphingobacterium]|uniref:hypothetical protein n=1 Tax=Sphingobacterium TaxID=28453 RepID=UPI001044E3DB|nr:MULTISPECIES: hypothetical protein [Sphingobacterium]MCW2263729.1 hypothetical protein [Sphingobacterium kitahiroshimense]TCR03795.1 hypothetical protein EDF67_11113 [Sphingobacterium sp. JUb78]